MRLLFLIAALLATAALAACGSDGSQPASSRSGVTHTVTVVTTPPGAPTSGTDTQAAGGGADTTGTGDTDDGQGNGGTPAPGTSSDGDSACVASDLELSFIGQQGATGHGELGFALRNTGSTPCHTYGYPGVLFLDADGGALPTQTARTTRDFAGKAPLRRLVLAPGDEASFRLIVGHGMGTDSGKCVTAHGLQAIAPDDTATLRVTIPDGAYECGGKTTVTPLQPGRSAYR